MEAVEAFHRGLDRDTLAIVDALCDFVAGAHSGLSERIKWNAPSFALDGDDRITLGLERKGGIRLVLHRGAKAKGASGFRFEDVDGLATWPAPDRGVVTIATLAEIEAKRPALSDLCRRWLAATR